MVGNQVHVVVLGPGVALKAGPFFKDQVAGLAEIKLVGFLAVAGYLIPAVADETAKGTTKFGNATVPISRGVDRVRSAVGHRRQLLRRQGHALTKLYLQLLVGQRALAATTDVTTGKAEKGLHGGLEIGM